MNKGLGNLYLRVLMRLKLRRGSEGRGNWKFFWHIVYQALRALSDSRQSRRFKAWLEVGPWSWSWSALLGTVGTSSGGEKGTRPHDGILIIKLLTAEICARWGGGINDRISGRESLRREVFCK